MPDLMVCRRVDLVFSIYDYTARSSIDSGTDRITSQPLTHYITRIESLNDAVEYILENALSQSTFAGWFQQSRGEPTV